MTGKWIGAGVAAAIVASVAVVIVQTNQSGSQQEEKTVTGCMRTGSSATVFLLRGASIGGPETPDAQAAAQQTEDYLLVAVPDSINLATHANHRLAITGVISPAASGPPPPAGANAAEKAMPRLTVKSIKMIAANCAAD